MHVDSGKNGSFKVEFCKASVGAQHRREPSKIDSDLSAFS